MKKQHIFNIILVLIVLIATTILLYGAEAWLAFEEWEVELGTTKRIERVAEKYGAKWDKRDKTEVIADLRKTGKDAHPAMSPSVFIESDGILVNGEKIFPLGGISNTTNVFCNEMGEYSIYDSDEHGFNNPFGSWKNKIDVAIIGDSFIHGACLKAGDDIASQLRKHNINSLNLGIGGAGPLIYSAVLKEYAAPIRPKVVVWSFYAVDIRDPIAEKNSPTLMQYIEDPHFSQHLYSNQSHLDRLLREYYRSAYQNRLDELTKLRKNRTEFITKKLLNEGIQLTKLRERIRYLGGRKEVTEGREVEKLELFEKTLRIAKTQTESWGGKFIFMYLPDWYTYGAKYDTYGIKVDANFLLRQDVLKIANDLGVTVLDIQAEVFDKNPDPLSLFNWRTYGHYNLEGYTKVSDELYSFLLNRQYIKK